MQTQRFPGVNGITWFTVGVSFLAFFLFNQDPRYLRFFAIHPLAISQGKYWWTLGAHMFVHASLVHLVVNMYVFQSLGRLCERVLGTRRFVWFYLLSGFFAGVLSVVLALAFGQGFWVRVVGSPQIFMLGASGAIFAIAGFFVVVLPKVRFSIILLPFFSLPAYIMVPLVLFATWVVSVLAGFPIGNVAHFGGFLSGLAYGFYARATLRERIWWIQSFVQRD